MGRYKDNEYIVAEISGALRVYVKESRFVVHISPKNIQLLVNFTVSCEVERYILQNNPCRAKSNLKEVLKQCAKLEDVKMQIQEYGGEDLLIGDSA